jgi:hypothetical protein
MGVSSGFSLATEPSQQLVGMFVRRNTEWRKTYDIGSVNVK